MGVLLRADNRTLVRGMPYSYLTTNYASGVASFVVNNTDGFAANDYIILGEIGHEQTEILQIQTVTAASGTLATTGNSRFAHSESTRVTKIPYNQIRFYWTSTTNFNTSNPVAAWAAITPDQWFSQVEDTTNTTGYGWFTFQNSTTAVVSGYSNPIPYANFGRNTVRKVLDGFFSSLNNKDLQLISLDDAYEWLNEAYDEARAELGLAIKEYDASDGTDTISVVAGTKEYALPTDFGSMVQVFFGNNERIIGSADVADVDLMDSTFYGLPDLHYYIRGSYIGFTPTPTEGDTIYYRYQKLPTDLNSYDDTIDLPNKGFNALKDFMLYRAKQKLRHSDATQFYEMFQARVAKMVVRARNRDASLDSIEPDISITI